MKKEKAVSTGSQKIDSLQTVRALAFWGVFSSHCGVTDLGAWGVSVFVLLSGFVMIYTYYDKTLENTILGSIRFSIRKIKRLYPLHILMTLAAFVFLIPTFAQYTFIYAGGLLLNLLLLQDWIPNSAIFYSWNAVAWYLSLCLFLYAAFPFILQGIQKITSSTQAIIVAITIYFIQCLIGFGLQYLHIEIPNIDNFSKWFTYIFPVFRLGDFIIGCCFGYVYLHNKVSIDKVPASIFEITVVVTIYVVQTLFVNPIGFVGTEGFRYNMLYTPTSLCLIYVFALRNGVVSNLLTCKPVLYLANISAYAFLIHQIVIRYIELIASHFEYSFHSNWEKLIIALVFTVFFSEIYLRLEKRFRNHNNQ